VNAVHNNLSKYLYAVHKSWGPETSGGYSKQKRFFFSTKTCQPGCVGFTAHGLRFSAANDEEQQTTSNGTLAHDRNRTNILPSTTEVVSKYTKSFA
jgi:hypothetical protein